MPTPKPSFCEFACPNCRTIVSNSVTECVHCRLPLDSLYHINDYEDFRKALQIDSTKSETGSDCRSLHLHFQIVSSSGETSWSKRIDRIILPQKIQLPDQNADSIELLSVDRRKIRVQYGTKTSEILLPGCHSFGEISLKCRLVVHTTIESKSCKRVREIAPKQIVLDDAKSVSIGSGKESGRGQLTHPEIALHHCEMIRFGVDGTTITSRADSCFFLADTGSKFGTFVNEQPIVSTRLETGDLVQIGPYAWTFNQEERRLIPAGPISGVAIRAENLLVVDRKKSHLDVKLCEIPAGEFAAIVGPSGSGKSTLLKLLAGLPARELTLRKLLAGLLKGDRLGGRVQVWDSKGIYDIEQAPSRYQKVLGYVPQQQIVHTELSAKQAVTFRARLRGKRLLDYQIDDMLYEVDLPRDRQRAPIGELSGGEKRRIATAVELITGPRLLLLDEPGSGLDEKRERELMTFLRNLSLRGCTVVIVTHNLRLAQEFRTRLIDIRNGRIEHGTDAGSIGTAGDLPSTKSPDVEEAILAGDATTSDLVMPSGRRIEVRQKSGALFHWFGQFHNQFGTLFHREWGILLSDWNRRLLLPALVVPMIFAGALGLAVERQSPGLLGFFAVLAVIWMGSSLSLLAIVGEREVFDHERHLFLRIPSYLAAKVTALGIVSLVQTLVFFGLLTAIRCFLNADRPDGHFSDPFSWTIGGKVFLVQVVVGWAAVGFGLLISAAVDRSREAANFILPLFMIAQIVFSVPISTGSSEDSIKIAYGEFRLQHNQSKKSEQDDGNKEHLRRWSGLISLATVSRYGDIALRSFAYHPTSLDPKKQKELNLWFRDACVVLGAFIIILPILTGLILYWQSRRGAILGAILVAKAKSRSSTATRSISTAPVVENPIKQPPSS